MFNIKKYGKFKKFDKNKKKKQIILCNSFRPYEEYLASLKYRNNGKYDKVPNYFITKDGDILSLIPDDSYSNFFYDNDINKNSIIICLENLGWLNKKPLDIHHTNWIGDIYNTEVYTKKWREKVYWAKYTEKQIESLVEISKKLLVKFSIDNKFIGHNTKVEGIKLYNGIVCRSNFNERYTDLNPSFEFEKFKQYIENER
jgi:N-acetyl-anhydromuramyl-L-alanine amidase AmpD